MKKCDEPFTSVSLTWRQAGAATARHCKIFFLEPDAEHPAGAWTMSDNWGGVFVFAGEGDDEAGGRVECSGGSGGAEPSLDVLLEKELGRHGYRGLTRKARRRLVKHGLL